MWSDQSSAKPPVTKASPPRNKWTSPRDTVVNVLKNADITSAAYISSGYTMVQSNQAGPAPSAAGKWAVPQDTMAGVLESVDVSEIDSADISGGVILMDIKNNEESANQDTADIGLFFCYVASFFDIVVSGLI